MSSGQIVLAIDHEPGERDPKSPFEGLITAEPSTTWRKVLAAQAKGAVGVLFVTDVHNHPGASNFEAIAQLLAAVAAADSELYAGRLGRRIRIPVAQISPALADRLIAGTGKASMRYRRNRRRSTASRRSRCLARASICASPSIATPCRIAMSLACSKGAIRS